MERKERARTYRAQTRVSSAIRRTTGPPPAVQEEDSNDAAPDEPEGSGETAQDEQGTGDAGEPADAEAEAGAAEAGAAEELKVVVSIKGGRATIGVQQPSSDPHIETFDDRDLSELAQEVAAVIGRARARWEEAPKHPAYERPAPPARRRNRRQQGAAQDAAAEGAADQQQPETLRLF